MRLRSSNLYLLLIVLACVSISRPLSALGKDIQVQFQLKDNTHTLHEPVVLVFRVHNASAKEAAFDLGIGKTQFFHFSLTTPLGKTLQNEPPYIEGFYPSGRIVIPPGGDYEQQLVLNQWFAFDSAGKYSLVAQVQGADSGEPRSPASSTQQIPIQIKERNPERLTKICSELTEKVKLAPNAQAAQEPALLLSYVQDQIAIPFLAKALAANKLTQTSVVPGLERIGNDAAVEVLLSALNDNFSDTASLARQALVRMRDRISNPALKARVQHALADKPQQ